MRYQIDLNESEATVRVVFGTLDEGAKHRGVVAASHQRISNGSGARC